MHSSPSEGQHPGDNLLQEQRGSPANAPFFSNAVQGYLEDRPQNRIPVLPLVPQYGFLGLIEQDEGSCYNSPNRLIMANLNIPWSAFICGSQGAGKSHTLSCLLQDNPASVLSYLMAGLVFHYDNFTSEETTQLCETAYLCSSGMPVTILCSPSNIWAMRRMYSNLHGLSDESKRPTVVPLYLSDRQLSISRILKLMAVDPVAKSTPLYMEIVRRIIREMAMEGTGFQYAEFRKRLPKVDFLPLQQTALNMRLQLLDSFLSPILTPETMKAAAADCEIFNFGPGTLTIVDLSDPFLSSDDACSLFSVCLSIFMENRGDCGGVVALDEAHKFRDKGP